jgi:hypothetical protein
MAPTTRYPFEAPYVDIEADIDAFVNAIFDALQSSFLLLPRGPGFVAYPDFQQAYEVLKRHTTGFAAFEPQNVLNALEEDALAFIILRAILGFTPPELAYVAAEESGVAISQNFARALDRRVRMDRRAFCSLSPQSQERVTILVATACQLLKEGAGEAPEDMIHRLDKADNPRRVHQPQASCSRGHSLYYAALRAISGPAIRRTPGFRLGVSG